MEHDEGKDERIKDDHREQSSWQFEEQRNSGEGNPVGAGDDQDDSQRHRRTVVSEGRCDAFNLAVDRRTRGIPVDEVRGRTRWEDRVRETEEQICKSARHGIC